eukprot:130267-Pyramimonas_sp.AAC.1
MTWQIAAEEAAEVARQAALADEYQNAIPDEIHERVTQVLEEKMSAMKVEMEAQFKQQVRRPSVCVFVIRASPTFETDAVKYTGSCTSAMPQSGGFHSPRNRLVKATFEFRDTLQPTCCCYTTTLPA